MRVLLFVCICVAAPVWASDGLEDLLGSERYHAMGLHRLTAEERARLLIWLQDTGRVTTPPVAPAPVPAPTSAPLPEVAQVAVAPVAPAAPAGPATVSAEAAEQLFGIEQTTAGQQEIRARIVGKFTGWSGDTEFVLDNGQVWRQSTPGTYRLRAEDPEVTITRALVGYKLRLVESRRSINVRRVK